MSSDVNAPSMKASPIPMSLRITTFRNRSASRTRTTARSAGLASGLPTVASEPSGRTIRIAQVGGSMAAPYRLKRRRKPFWRRVSFGSHDTASHGTTALAVLAAHSRIVISTAERMPSS